MQTLSGPALAKSRGEAAGNRVRQSLSLDDPQPAIAEMYDELLSTEKIG